MKTKDRTGEVWSKGKEGSLLGDFIFFVIGPPTSAEFRYGTSYVNHPIVMIGAHKDDPEVLGMVGNQPEFASSPFEGIFTRLL